ncbi:LOW QUALITY PROTEIN: hypothetical protein V2J09_018342 [Rumex salicifolius]
MINNIAHGLVDGSFDRSVDSLLGNAKKSLYAGCSNFTKLSATLKLYNLKATNGWSDKSFTNLVSEIYEKKIHPCPDDCILYQKDTPHWRVVRVVKLHGIRRTRFQQKFFGIFQLYQG